MATKGNDEFKFPDEVEDEKKENDIEVEYDEENDEIKVEVEDDTPPEDRHVEPLNESVKEELEKADESKDYTHNVKTKFKQ